MAVLVGLMRQLLILSFFSNVVQTTKGGVCRPIRTQETVESKQERDKALKTLQEKSQQQKQIEEVFLARFLQMSPQERVQLWKKGQDVSGVGLTQRYIDDALIAVGTDAAPYLAEIVRGGDSYHQAYAVQILCDMDRFVKLEDMPVSSMPDSIYVKPLKVGGRVNQFMVVDGRRIGKEGYAAVNWAAGQTRNNDLRIHTRFWSGMLDQELRQLSLGEILTQWRQGVIKSKGVLAVNTNEYNVSFLLKNILVEKAPESIPALIEILDGETNGYVREEAVTVLYSIDLHRMRLRGTELGKKAIEAIHRAAKAGGFKPVFTTREKVQEQLLKNFDNRAFRDEVEIFDLDWAKSLKQLCGVPLDADGASYLGKTLPELRQFITYLTKVDPYFPSWEFTSVFSTRDVVLHPLFKAKMARYCHYWKIFKAESATPVKVKGGD